MTTYTKVSDIYIGPPASMGEKKRFPPKPVEFGADINLKFDIAHPDVQGRNRHELITDLGITYEYSESVTIADCIVFYNCGNVPDDLPHWLTRVQGRRV